MKKLIIFLIICLILNVAGSWGYERPSMVAIKFEDGTIVNAEIAKNKAKGLMFREELRENEGMLFTFDEEGIYSFWMKNMKFPIDIIWFDKDFKVVHIEENVQPCTTNYCPTYKSNLPAKYVLEVSAHFSSSHYLNVGDVAFKGVEYT
jgi:hypothetical protein